MAGAWSPTADVRHGDQRQVQPGRPGRSRECETDLVSFEMTLLTEAVGDVLAPLARAQQGS
jgi:hypothetical protein